MVVLIMANACFTGVESTPKINAEKIKDNKTAITEEQSFLADVIPQKPSLWKKGKKFLVDDNRIERIFESVQGEASDLKGMVLKFDCFKAVPSLTGDDVAEISFSKNNGGTLRYRLPITIEQLDTIKELEIPFTVDLDLVAHIDSVLRGKSVYIKTPNWYSLDSHKAIQGLRHIKVIIDSVVPGSSIYPAAVAFTIDPNELAQDVFTAHSSGAVLLTVGSSRTSTRNFDTLFSFKSPRAQYPRITEDNWKHIVKSSVISGMSRDECRLALGSPSEIIRIPTTGGMQERWIYSDGVFLIFDDGFLSKYRL